MEEKINLKSNSIKFIIQGFFFAGAMAIADTSTVLPLIVHYFSGSNVLVGTFSALLRGGAILMQLYAAFYAQSYPKVLPYLRVVFIFRFLSWFSLGLVIYYFSTYSDVVLILFALGMFIFSFSAGFGAVYYQELLGKSFSKEYRGKVLAGQQFASGFAGILSGGLSAFLLEAYPKPESFAYIFIISGLIMLLSFSFMYFFKEEEKVNLSVKEKKFSDFVKNSIKILKSDKNLRIQIVSRLIAYSFWFILPFIILNAKDKVGITGNNIGIIISLQMAGAMLSNILWGKLSSAGKNKQIVLISSILMIFAIFLSIIANSIYFYYILFFFAGAAIDGFRLSFSNLILIISPEDKRPVYVAVQNNITSIGMFFSIPGGAFISFLGFNFTAIFSTILLIIGFLYSFRLKRA
ncbi:MAG: MFS transporter [Bacteroidales bacterium]|nr:MFS transporter [Bacteroidales bacterium]MBN2757296.1 MFS transporter [Bacteroidales bacterium]